MFAKPPSAPAEPPPPTGAAAVLAAARGVIATPAVALSLAVLFFVCAGAGVIALAGNPDAGAPVVRLSLARLDGTPPPGWRESLPGESHGAPQVQTGDLALSINPIGDDAHGGAPPGQVVITLPGGQTRQLAAPGDPLPQAPLPGMTAPGPGGLLPVISSDGRASADVYSRPFVSNGRPRVALVIGGLGLNAQLTRRAIEELPAEVTLSFVPYADGLQGWIDLARAHGHEVLLETPMEPADYPNNDPGPYTLMANGQEAETTRRLEWLLSRATGYFGVTNYLGGRFVQNAGAMAIFTGALRQRGLAFIDDGSAARTAGGLPRASADRIIDDNLSAEGINTQLAALEAAARRGGKALGSGFAYPVTIEAAAAWAQGLEARGLQLAPASAVAVRR
ncbi:MAG TPA: divergent polysaccharide deacetylase family protein [Phenylobacterium sp.]|nr:divergent polysaccharide deacetylase family protein [Phenylobacterium sp.]